MIDFRSRTYSVLPTSDGAVHELRLNSDTFESTFTPSGLNWSSDRLPSSSNTTNFPSAYTKLAFENPRSRHFTSPVLTLIAVNGAGPKSPLDPNTRSPTRYIVPW